MIDASFMQYINNIGNSSNSNNTNGTSNGTNSSSSGAFDNSTFACNVDGVVRRCPIYRGPKPTGVNFASASYPPL